jgi:hypothetical protein
MKTYITNNRYQQILEHLEDNDLDITEEEFITEVIKNSNSKNISPTPGITPEQYDTPIELEDLGIDNYSLLDAMLCKALDSDSKDLSAKEEEDKLLKKALLPPDMQDAPPGYAELLL